MRTSPGRSASCWPRFCSPTRRASGALAVTFEDLHDRRLASAVGPKKGVDLAPPNLETHPVDGTQPTVVLAQSLDHDGGRLAGRHTFHATDHRSPPAQAPET